jgi:uncharacterized protein YjbI with pentapeptide repeats
MYSVCAVPLHARHHGVRKANSESDYLGDSIFLQAVEIARSLTGPTDGPVYTLHDATIVGTFDLTHRTVDVAVDIQNCEFKNDVDLRNCDFKQPVNFSGCTFRRSFNSGDIIGSHTIYRKNLVCDGATFEGPASFRGCWVEGDARFMDCSFRGEDPVDFSLTRFGKTLQCQDACFSSPAVFHELRCSSLECNATTFEHSVSFTRIECAGDGLFHDASFKHSVDFHSSSFGADLVCAGARFLWDANFASLRCDNLRCPGAEFWEEATFDSVKCNNGLFSDVVFRSDAVLTDAFFGGSLDCKSSTFEGAAYFNYLTCSRDATFAEARFESKAVFVRAHFQRTFDCTASKFSGVVYFDSLKCDGDAIFIKALFENPAGVNFGQASLAGRLDVHDAIFHGPVSWPADFELADGTSSTEIADEDQKTDEDQSTEIADEDQRTDEDREVGLSPPVGGLGVRLHRIFIQPVLTLSGKAKKTATDLGEQAEKVHKKVEEVAEPAAFTFAPVAGALAGFIAALIPLAYPAGLIALWIQVTNYFDYGLWKALYAASLAQSAIVVGKVTFIVAFSFLSALVPMWAWYAYARAKVKDDFHDEDHSKRRKQWVNRIFMGYAVLLLLGCIVSLLLAEMPKDDIPDKLSLLTGRWTFWLILLFLVITVAEVVFGGVIFFLRGIQEEEWKDARGPLYLGLAVVYVGSLAAGVCLAGLQSPSLPTTVLTLGEPEGKGKEVRVGILSNSNGYWYVVNYCKNDEFLAVSNTKVADVDTIVDDPSTLEKKRSKKECDTTEPKTTIDSGPSGPTNDNNATFDFSSNEKRSTFKCSIDDKDYARCNSSQDYTRLSDGEHTFSVKAIDAVGNPDNTPAQRTWTVC